MTQVNRSMTGKVTFEIPTNTHLTSWSRNPNINAQLTLKDSAGSEVKFTSDATGKFELGKLNEGDYTYEIVGIIGGGTTIANKISGRIKVNGRNVSASESRSSAVPPAIAPPPGTTPGTTSIGSAGSLEGVSIAERMNALNDMFRENVAPLEQARANMAISEEEQEAILAILSDTVTADNINTRRISLQTHLQKLIKDIKTEEGTIKSLMEHYEIHAISETIKGLENAELPPTEAEIKAKFDFPKVDSGKFPELAAKAETFEEEKLKLIDNSNSLKDKVDEAKTATKAFDKKTLSDNKENLKRISRSKAKYEEKLTKIIAELNRGPNEIRLNNLQGRIGDLISKNDTSADITSITNFGTKMDEEIEKLNNISQEIEELIEAHNELTNGLAMIMSELAELAERTS